MKKERTVNLAFLGFLIYFASYVTRINYGAVISEIVFTEGIAKSSASLAVTASFITYGIGQLFSGYLGDKTNPKKLIFLGLFSSSLFNLLLPLSLSPLYSCAVWAINGFSQSLIWPPLVKILAENLTTEKYKKACVTVSAASSIGTVAVYLFSPVIIRIFSWKAVFFLSAISGNAVSFFWFFAAKQIAAPKKQENRKEETRHSDNSGNFGKIIAASGLIPIAAAILLQGILRDGITTWTPSYLAENYGLPSTFSIITSVAVPVFSIFALKITEWINKRKIPNELFLAAILFAAAGIATLCSAGINSLWFSVLLMPVAVGCMHGINLLLVCQIPGKFSRYGKVSLLSGTMNFFTYIGSALSTYGIAKITENTGWFVALTVYTGVAAAGALICFSQKKRWRKFSETI